MAEKVYTKPKCLLPLSSGFCPGCLHSLATKLIAESIDELGVAERVINVLPVGWATMNSLYWKLDMGTSAHGRAREHRHRLFQTHGLSAYPFSRHAITSALVLPGSREKFAQKEKLPHFAGAFHHFSSSIFTSNGSFCKISRSRSMPSYTSVSTMPSRPSRNTHLSVT